LIKAASSLWMLTVAQLRDRAASIDPTPGGGSISIIAATLGVASIHKGVAVTLKKSADSVRNQSLLDLRSKAVALITSLSALADADSQAFQGYMEACALPRATEDEKSARKAAKEESLVRATQVPLKAAGEMGQGVELVDVAAELVDAHVRSEVLAGGVLLRAAIRSVLLSVDANLLAGISNASLHAALKQQRDELEHRFSFG
jgi:methenyltetrahydrofolate cyclohydrolase